MRAATRTRLTWSLASGSAPSGSQTSAVASAMKPEARTPITLYSDLSSEMVRPARLGSLAKRRIQSSWLMTTTRGPPGRSSIFEKTRPMTTFAPNKGKLVRRNPRRLQRFSSIALRESDAQPVHLVRSHVLEGVRVVAPRDVFGNRDDILIPER